MARFDTGCNCDACCAEREYQNYEGDMREQARRAILRGLRGKAGKNGDARVNIVDLSNAIVDELKIACGMEDDIGTTGTDDTFDKQNAHSSFMLH